MWSPEQRHQGEMRASLMAALLLALGVLAGCGFRPLYGGGTSGEVPAELSQIEIGPIKDRHGQYLRTQLQTLLTPKGEPESPRYLLKVTYTEAIQELAFQRDQFATRANFRLNVIYSLYEKNQKSPFFSGSDTSVASFDIVRSPYATEAARDDAFERAATAVTADIKTRLAVVFAERQDKPQPATRP